MDELDRMSIKELNEVTKRTVVNLDILMKDVKDIKYTLIGNEMNNHTGLIKEFSEFKNECKTFQKETNDRLETVEHYQTGMKWGTRIIVFITGSTIFLQFTDGIKWLYHTIFEK